MYSHARISRHALRCARIGIALVASIMALASATKGATFAIPDGDVAALIAAINTANGNGEADVIDLAPGGTYTLTAIDNADNGLPVVTSAITINGNGATIERSSAAGTPDFRVVNVSSSGGSLTLNKITIRGGKLYSNGAGILNAGSLTMVDGTVSNNRGDGGAGICNYAGTVELITSVVTENTDRFFGAGVWNDGYNAVLKATGCSISNNHGRLRGTGIYNLGGAVTLIASIVSGNTDGAGIMNHVPGSTLVMTNCTVCDNRPHPTEGGGGIVNSGGVVSISHCTITDNDDGTASGGLNNGGGISNDAGYTAPYGTVTIRNTIVADNAPSDLNGTITTLGYNIYRNPGAATIVGSGTGDLGGVDPLLGPLANNGGLTLTRALLVGSPAIDKVPAANCLDAQGNPVATDQRGIGRPQGAQADIGAVEFTWSCPMTVANGDVAGLICAIHAANANPGADVISLAPGGTYTLSAVDNSDYALGPNGLPAITSDITINGNGAVIERSTTAGTPDFRLFTVWSGTLILNNVTVRGGRNLSGGGGILSLAPLTLNGCTIADNAADSWGGGIYSVGPLVVTNTTVRNNTTFGTGNLSGGGGGIFTQGAMTATNVTWSDNTTLGRGGAFYNLDIAATLLNCTISGNTARNGGGYFNRAGSVSCTHVTASGNHATDQGGGFWNYSGTGTLKNTIVANSSPTDLVGSFTTLGYNLIANAATGTLAGSGTGDITGVDPMLAPLADNGGPTQTYALLPGSPAADKVPMAYCTDPAGASVTADQRGIARPQNTLCDIGAFERVPVAPTIGCPESITLNTDPQQCGAVATFDATVTGDPVPVVVFTPPSGSVFPVGTTHVTAVATNSVSSATCAFDVTVVDKEPPVIAVPASITANPDAGEIYATVTYDVTAADNCSATLSIDPPSGSHFPYGSSTVTATATDPSGNKTVQSFTVTVAEPGVSSIVVTPADAHISIGATQQYTATAHYDDGSTEVLSNGAPLPAGVVAWWRGENSADDLMHTSDGSLVHGTTFTDGKVGRAFKFDGANDDVTVIDNSALNLTGPMSMEAWFRSDGNAGGMIVSKMSVGGSGSAFAGYSLHVNPSGAGTGLYGSIAVNFFSPAQKRSYVNTRESLGDTKNYNDGQWHHVVGTFDVDGRARLYIDGTLRGVADNSIPSIGTPSIPLTIGSRKQSPLPIKGCVDEVTIYNRALTADEVAAIYNAGVDGKSRVRWSSNNAGVAAIDAAGSATGANPGVTTITATMPAGAPSGSTSLHVATPPTLTCPDPVTATTDPGQCAAVVTFSPTVTGDPAPTLVCTPPSGSTFPLGTSTVTCVATNVAGSAPGTFTVTVIDKEAPDISIPADFTVTTDPGKNYATVTYSPSVTDNCSATMTVDPPSGSHLMVGQSIMTVTGVDASGNTSVKTCTVTVVDKEPPVITVGTPTQAKWPVTHQYSSFTVGALVASATDNVDGSVLGNVRIAKVSSDEANGGSSASPDIVIAGDCKSVNLRMERSGSGNGRVYTITFEVADAAGNIGSATCTVCVPHDQAHPAVADAPQWFVAGTCGAAKDADGGFRDAGRAGLVPDIDDNPIHLQIAPNPFRSAAEVLFDVPAEDAGQPVEVKVFDLVGHDVTTLVHEVREAGHYAVTFSAAQLVTGRYVAAVHTATHMQSKMMVVVK